MTDNARRGIEVPRPEGRGIPEREAVAMRGEAQRSIRTIYAAVTEIEVELVRQRGIITP